MNQNRLFTTEGLDDFVNLIFRCIFFILDGT